MMPPSRTVRWLVVAIVVLIACIGILFYRQLDTSISLDHARQQQKSNKEENELLHSLLFDVASRFNRSEIEKLIAERYSEKSIVKSYGNHVEVDGVVLHFEGERLVRVESLQNLDH